MVGPGDNADMYEVGLRERQRKEKMIEYLGDMLIPATTGFPQINLDMAFTNLAHFDLVVVQNLSSLITYCHINGFKKSEYMCRSQLATFLNSRRSKDGKSMDMFTTITTKSSQSQEFKDTTTEKKGFSLFSQKQGSPQGR
jgi:hypothetical protein